MSGAKIRRDAERRKWWWIEEGETGVRRFDKSPFLLMLLCLLTLFAWHSWYVLSLKPYLASSLQAGKPAIAYDGVERVVGEAKAAAANALLVERPPQESLIPTIRLEVPKNTLIEMERAKANGDPELGHDEGGDKPYFSARINLDDQALQRCKVCLRGTMEWHHDFSKPSLRVKLKKADMRGGQRYIELTRPEDALGMKNWLPCMLGEKIGLISEQIDHVRLFINNKYYGVYQRSMRQGELMALKSQRMPGTFFKGDFGGDLWESTEFWKSSGDCLPEDLETFNDFIELLKQPMNQEGLAQLRLHLNFEMYARWSALMAVTGSLHTDHAHNHSYFFTGVNGLIEPIPWDSNSFGVHADPTSPVNAAQHPVIKALLCDPEWVHRRNQWIHQLIEEVATPDSMKSWIRQRFNRMKRDLVADANLTDVVWTRVGWVQAPVAVTDLVNKRIELENWIDARYEYLRNFISHVTVVRTPDPNHPELDYFWVSGNVAVEAIGAEKTMLHPGLSQDLEKYISVPVEGAFQIPFATSKAISYPAPVSAKRNFRNFRNAITGDPVTVVERSDPTDENALATRTILPEKKMDGEPVIVLGPGRVELTEDLHVAADRSLVIKPGTSLFLAEDVGIYCEGQALWVGTKEQPIHIRPLDRERPFGALAIFGSASKDSRWEHIDVEGGSVGRWHNHRFKGMVNAYHCPMVTLANCRFGTNFVGDDTVNLAKSTFVARNCLWENSRADALDSDMSEGTLENCRWVNSGNDGLDMMTSKIELHHSEVIGSVDKGISVGEDSRLYATDVKMVRCNIGIQIKDDSLAELNDCEFRENKCGAHAYQKKWFYSKAGTGIFTACRFNNNQRVDVEARKRSKFWLVETPIRSFAGDPKRIDGADMGFAIRVAVDSVEVKQ